MTTAPDPDRSSMASWLAAARVARTNALRYARRLGDRPATASCVAAVREIDRLLARTDKPQPPPDGCPDDAPKSLEE